MKSIAKVVVGLPVDGPFDYAIPEALENSLSVGQRVRVPFGGREVAGYICGFTDESDLKELKQIISADKFPLLSLQLITLSLWMADYYGCSQGEAVEIMLPFALRKRKKLPLIPVDLKNQDSQTEGNAFLYLSQDRKSAFLDLDEKIKECLSVGKGVLLLAPDRVVLKKIYQRFSDGFDEPLICLNQESSKEQIQEWVKLCNGEARYAVGLRSGVFAPVRNLGLVIMFDEQFYGYQDDQTPFYHTRDVLLKRAQIEKFDVIFSCIAPTVELWSLFQEKPEQVKYFKVANPSKFRLIDLTNYKPQPQSFLSFPLANSISSVLDNGGRVVIIYNRRGFNTYTKCADCGHVISCPRCGVPYTFMLESKNMLCASCGHSDIPAKKCPACGKQYLRSYGEGIERIESNLARFFSQAWLAVFDRNTDVFPKKANLIIATQAILRVIEDSDVNLIAVLDADGALNRFDFRAHQKFFSLLTNLRCSGADEIVVQTRDPMQSTLQHVLKNDLESFYEHELASREDLALPPKGHLLLVLFRGKNEAAVAQQVDLAYEHFLQGPSEGIEVLPPQPDFQAKLRDQYRLMIMIKAQNVERTIRYIKTVLAGMKKKRGVIVTVQVDP